MSACIPASRAARATAWAWLPLDTATTPSGSSGSARTALVAPRILNEPVRCSDSHFRYSSRPLAASRPGERSTGVRQTQPAMRARAASRAGLLLMARGLSPEDRRPPRVELEPVGQAVDAVALVLVAQILDRMASALQG